MNIHTGTSLALLQKWKEVEGGVKEDKMKGTERERQREGRERERGGERVVFNVQCSYIKLDSMPSKKHPGLECYQSVYSKSGYSILLDLHKVR